MLFFIINIFVHPVLNYKIEIPARFTKFADTVLVESLAIYDLFSMGKTIVPAKIFATSFLNPDENGKIKEAITLLIYPIHIREKQKLTVDWVLGMYQGIAEERGEREEDRGIVKDSKGRSWCWVKFYHPLTSAREIIIAVEGEKYIYSLIYASYGELTGIMDILNSWDFE